MSTVNPSLQIIQPDNPECYSNNANYLSGYMWMQQQEHPSTNQDFIFNLDNEGLYTNSYQIPVYNNQTALSLKETSVEEFFTDRLELDCNSASRDRTDEWIEQHNSQQQTWILEESANSLPITSSSYHCSYSQPGDNSSLASPNTIWTTSSNSIDLTDITWCSSSSSSNSAIEIEKSSRKLEVEFLSSSQNTKRDSTKFTKCAQVVLSPDENRPPTVYVARGRLIDISIKCNQLPPPGSRLRFLVFSLTGGLRSPVVGSDSQLGGSDDGQNLCFVQQPVRHNSNNGMNTWCYEHLPGDFLALSIPVFQREFITTLLFPFHNSKCLSTLKKDVRLNVSLVSSTNLVISETEFQLVSCYSPVRDAIRHREKLNESEKESFKSDRDMNLKRINASSNSMLCNDATPFKKSKQKKDEATVTEVDGRLKYIIMTDNLEIWKILENLRQQLTPLVDPRAKTEPPNAN